MKSSASESRATTLASMPARPSACESYAARSRFEETRAGERAVRDQLNVPAGRDALKAMQVGELTREALEPPGDSRPEIILTLARGSRA